MRWLYLLFPLQDQNYLKTGILKRMTWVGCRLLPRIIEKILLKQREEDLFDKVILSIQNFEWVFDLFRVIAHFLEFQKQKWKIYLKICFVKIKTLLKIFERTNLKIYYSCYNEEGSTKLQK